MGSKFLILIFIVCCCCFFRKKKWLFFRGMEIFVDIFGGSLLNYNLLGVFLKSTTTHRLGHFTLYKVLVIPKKQWLRPSMTENGTLNNNQTKPKTSPRHVLINYKT